MFHSPLDPPLDDVLLARLVQSDGKAVTQEQVALGSDLEARRVLAEGIGAFVPRGQSLGTFVVRQPVAWAAALRADTMLAAPEACSVAHVAATADGSPDGGSRVGVGEQVSGEGGVGRPVGCLVFWSSGLAVGRQLEAQVIRWLPAGISPKAMLM